MVHEIKFSRLKIGEVKINNTSTFKTVKKNIKKTRVKRSVGKKRKRKKGNI